MMLSHGLTISRSLVRIIMRPLRSTRRRPRTPCSSTQFLATFVSVIWNNVVPLFCRGAGDESDDGFGVAHVEDFMRHAGLDVNEIAGLGFEHLFATVAEFMADFAFDDVEDYFEIDVDVRVSDAARRNGCDIG